MRRLSLSVPVLLVLAGCVATPPVVVPPTPRPTPAPAPPPVRPVRPAPLPQDWRDWPLTPGTWDYRQDARGSIALYGMPGADAELTLRCDRARRMVYLSRHGGADPAPPAPITIRTTESQRTLAGQATGGPYLSVALAPRDNVLDAMGYSRGRFLVETPSLPTLVVPAWAEILRVTEDCR